ncbi:MAG: hypothetical protein AAF560_29305, partial [Acidobacteriota bacterium]
FNEIAASINEAIRVCADVDGDGASDLMSHQGVLRCAPVDPHAPPVTELMTLAVQVPCDGGPAEAAAPSVEQVLDALIAKTTRDVMIAQDGGLGIEITVDVAAP